MGVSIVFYLSIIQQKNPENPCHPDFGQLFLAWHYRYAVFIF